MSIDRLTEAGAADRLRRFASPLILAVGCMTAGAALVEHAIHLRGIINLPELKEALLEVDHSLVHSNGPPTVFSMTRLVKVGDKFEDRTIKGAHVQFEILEINAEIQQVKLQEDGKITLCGFERADGIAPSKNAGLENVGIRLQNARFQDVIDLYSALKDRTVLIHPEVSWSALSLQRAGQSNADITAAIEGAFLDKEIVMIADGEKFVLMLPRSKAATITGNSMRLERASPQFGSIYLECPISAMVETYGRVLERKRAGNERIPGQQIYLRTKLLSKAEALYAFDRLLEWNGLKIVLMDDTLFKVVRIGEGP